MSKIKRNEPCPCGSGKKYKRCCGSANATNSTTQSINNELFHLHRMLISSVMSKYNNKLNDIRNRYNKPAIEEDQETAEIYQTGLTLWILLNVPCFKNNRTIFEEFLKNNTGNMSKTTKNTFSKWEDCVPSVYEVVSVSQEKKLMSIKEISSDKLLKVPYHEEDDFIEDSLIIGTLVPYADQYGFFFSLIKLYHHDKALITKLIEQYTGENQRLNDNFPDFLADALVLGKENSEWENLLHEEVAQLFANHLVDKNISDEILFKGVSLWRKYCSNVNPSYKNIHAYAAALEYMVQKYLLHNRAITQSQLAKEYECSDGSVSTNYRKLSKELESELAK